MERFALTFVDKFKSCAPMGSFFVALLLLSTLSVHVFKYSFIVKDQKPSRWYNLSKILILLLSFAYFGYAFWIKHTSDHNSIINIAGIYLSLITLQLLRAFLDSLEQRHYQGFANISIIQNAGGAFANIVVFTGVYAAILHGESNIFRLSGVLLASFNIFKILKYRLYDDFYLRSLDKSGSYLINMKNIEINPKITLLQGIYNVFLRAYFFVTLSFACIYAIMVKGSYDHCPDVFIINNRSGNLLVDFLYFSIVTISTVGYGDISPVGIIPKIITAFEIAIGYFFLGMTFALIINRYSSRSGE